MMDPDPGPDQDYQTQNRTSSNFFFLISSVQGLKLITMFFCCNFSLIFAYIKQNQRLPLKKKLYFIILVDLYASLSQFFLWYPDPDQRFLMRIRILPNDTDPTETLISCQGQYYYVRTLNCTGLRPFLTLHNPTSTRIFIAF